MVALLSFVNLGLSSSLIATALEPDDVDDALNEAEIRAVYFNAVASRLVVVFDRRTSLAKPAAAVAIFVSEGVRKLGWDAPSRASHLTAWTVNDVAISAGTDHTSFTVGCWPAPGGILTVSAESALLVFGDIADLPEMPPDFEIGSVDPKSVLLDSPDIDTTAIWRLW